MVIDPPDEARAREHLAHLRAEAQRLRDEAVRQIRIAHRRVQFWAYLDILLGFPAALLAGISGAAGLASPDARVPAAMLALVSAGLSAGTGFLRSDTRRRANMRSRQAWATVEAEAGLVLAQTPYLDRDALQQALRTVFDMRRAALTAYEGESPAASLTNGTSP